MTTKPTTPRLLELDKEPEVPASVKTGDVEYPLITPGGLAGDPRLQYRVRALETRIETLEKAGEAGTLTKAEEDELITRFRQKVGLFIPTMPDSVLDALTDAQVGNILLHMNEHVLPLVIELRAKRAAISAAREGNPSAGRS